MLHISINIFASEIDTISMLLRHVQHKVHTGQTASVSELYPHSGLHFVVSGEADAAEPLTEGAVVVLASDCDADGGTIRAHTMGQIVNENETHRTLIFSTGQTVTLRTEDWPLTPVTYLAYFDAHEEEFLRLEALVAGYHDVKSADLPPGLPTVIAAADVATPVPDTQSATASEPEAVLDATVQAQPITPPAATD